MSKRGIPFIAIGTALLGIGVSGQRAFIYAGIDLSHPRPRLAETPASLISGLSPSLAAASLNY
jgi:hypothetical protein